MARPEDILKRVRIAAPCPARWESMKGDDRTRFCSQCKLNVYNLSDMTSKDAAKLVSENEGRLCVRYYQRRDGTVLTRDCPVGIRLIRRTIANTAACALVLLMASFAFASNIGRRTGSEERTSLFKDARTRMGHIEPFRTVLDWIDPPQPAPLPAVPGMMVLTGATFAPLPTTPAPPAGPAHP